MSRLLLYLRILILFIVCGSVTHATETERSVTDETGREEYADTEKPESLVTWVYDGTSFTPVAKVAGGERYTIVHDDLGTPTQAYDSEGNLVWEMLLDVYGEVMESRGDRSLVPFRYQGLYEDAETGLYYNRFRYYSPEMGMYISSDPIGLAGNNPTLYGYVQDVNIWLDPWGLQSLIYDFKDFNQARNEALRWLEERGFKAEKQKLGKFGDITGKPVGMQTVDGKVDFRVVYDARNGAHINVWSGKERGPHFTFTGSEDTVKKIQGHYKCKG